MKRFYGEFFVRLSAKLGTRSALSEALAPIVPSAKKIRAREQDARDMEEWREQCLAVGLRVSAAYAQKLIDAIRSKNPPSLADHGQALAGLNERMEEELGARFFLQIEDGRAELFQNAQPFGDKVAEAFPSTALDIEEAAKCYALSRNTACVMHLMRVLECGLNALGTALGVQLNVPGWGPILKRIDDELGKKYTQKPPAWKQDERFYAESAALLRSVQYAWRNPAMHVTHIYDDDKALEVFQATRGFMRHLAQKLQEHPTTP